MSDNLDNEITLEELEMANRGRAVSLGLQVEQVVDAEDGSNCTDGVEVEGMSYTLFVRPPPEGPKLAPRQSKN